MRALLSAVLLLSLGCGAGGAVPVVEGATPPCEVTSAWERLHRRPVTFELHPGASRGSFTTHRTVDPTSPLPVELHVTSGRVELLAGWHWKGQLLSVTRFEGALADVHLTPEHLPPSGLTLTNVSFRLTRAVAVPVRWLGDGAVGFAAGVVPVELHASLRTSTGEASPLEVAHFDALPLEFTVERRPDDVLLLTAKAAQGGVLWRWGGLFELGNLEVTMEASETDSLLEVPTPGLGTAP